MILKLVRKLLNATFLENVFHNVTIDSSPKNENPSFTHPHVVPNLYDILKNVPTVFVHTMKVDVVQNNYYIDFYCIDKKYFCKGWQNVHFWVNYPSQRGF